MQQHIKKKKKRHRTDYVSKFQGVEAIMLADQIPAEKKLLQPQTILNINFAQCAEIKILNFHTPKSARLIHKRLTMQHRNTYVANKMCFLSTMPNN